MAEYDFDDPRTRLVPVLPLRDAALFPEATLVQLVARPSHLRALEIAARTGGPLLALGHRDTGPLPLQTRDFHGVGTLARVAEDAAQSDQARRVELDGVGRARVLTLAMGDAVLAEIELLDEGETGDEWGPAVEALARYLHAHAELRAFLDQQRRSADPMSWVNLACQHLPITASARQKLLDSPAADRCQRISRGLDALLKKEKGD